MSTGENLVLRDPITHEIKGWVDLRTGDNGQIVVSKVTGAQFDPKAKVEIPVYTREVEEAERVIGGSESFKTFEKDWGNSAKPPGEKPEVELSIPAISGEAKVDIGKVASSAAVFDSQGGGYEFGFTTKEDAANIGGELSAGGGSEKNSFAGAAGGAGVQFGVFEGFTNFFGRPEVDDKGNFTRSVIGGSLEVHGTLAEIEGRVGCFEDKGCGLGASIGAVAIGFSGGLNYAEKAKITVQPVAEVGDQGLASEVSQTGVPFYLADPGLASNVEQEALATALSAGGLAALQAFLLRYPDSPYAEDAQGLIDSEESDQTSPPPPQLY